MKILAVDTSSLVATVAVAEDTRLLGEYSINHKKTHSQKLMPMVKELMKSLELEPKDIDVYAASVGPGSFTGLRIGVTSVKAMAYAYQKPVVAVPTLDALAYNLPVSDGLICPMLDARNSQVFTSVYRWKANELEMVTEYMGVTVAELVKLIKDMNEKIVFLGDGVDLHRNFLYEELGNKAGFAPQNLLYQRASSVAYAAYLLAREGKVETSFELSPFYLRKSQAERELDKKMGNCCT